MYKISELEKSLKNKTLDDRFDKTYGGDKNSI